MADRTTKDGAVPEVSPESPDVLEQRQRPDGTLEEATPVDEVPDRPLTPDELEQRLVVEDDDEDDHPRA